MRIALSAAFHFTLPDVAGDIKGWDLNTACLRLSFVGWHFHRLASKSYNGAHLGPLH